MKTLEDFLEALSDTSIELLTLDLDLTDPDHTINELKKVDLKPAETALKNCLKKLKAFQNSK